MEITFIRFFFVSSFKSLLCKTSVDTTVEFIRLIH